MRDAEVGAAARALRHRLGWRQADVAIRAAVGQRHVARFERGDLDSFTLRTARKIGAVVGLEINLDARWRGGELARLLDADHAAIQHRLAEWLTAAGWLVRAEVSFSRYGERGSYDLLAFHPERGLLLVVEVKTVVTDLQSLLRQLDVKTRLARSVASELGWQARAVVPVLVIADSRTARRRIQEHHALFARFSLRGRAARAWLRSPDSSPDGVLLFERLPSRPGRSGRQAGRQRVRPRPTESSVEKDPGPA